MHVQCTIQFESVSLSLLRGVQGRPPLLENSGPTPTGLSLSVSPSKAPAVSNTH